MRRIVFLSLILWCETGSHVPTFSIKENARIQSIHRLPNSIHCRHIVNAHQIKAETIDLVLFYPVREGINHVLAVHFMLTCRLITDTCPILEAPIWLHPVIIIRNCILERTMLSWVGMIVDHIYDYRNPSFMISPDHSFKLFHRLLRIGWIRWKTGFWCRMILNVVTPIVGHTTFFIVLFIAIRYRLQLHDIDP